EGIRRRGDGAEQRAPRPLRPPRVPVGGSCPPDVRVAARGDRPRLLRPAEVAHAWIRELRLRRDRVPAGQARARRHPGGRRAGRRAVARPAPRLGVRARPGARRAFARKDPAPDVRRPDPGCDRLARDRARDREGEAEGRAREVLRRRHHAQTQAVGAAEGGQEAHEASRDGRGSAGGIPGSFEPERREEVSGARHLYVHLPFCAHRCGYCDFVTLVGRAEQHDAYVDALLAELEFERALLSSAVETVFLGGGTPTFTEPRALRRLLEMLPPAAEVTVEANPETVTPALAALLRDGRVNRVSLGAQS